MRTLLKNAVLRWLWWGASRRIRREQPYVVAITGSVGKTTAKDAIALVLAQTGRPVFKTPGNLSTDFGVALALLGFKEVPDGLLEWISALLLACFPPRTPGKGQPYYVLEFSADKPGDIAFLAAKVPFKVGVLTSIVPVHMQFYKEFQTLVKEKHSLFKGLDKDGYAVLNADDPAQASLASSLPTVVLYGMEEGAKKAAAVVARAITFGRQGLRCTLEYKLPSADTDDIALKTTVLGRHQLYPLLAAATVGLQEGIAPQAVVKALGMYQVPAGRGRIIEGLKDILIVDDTYNASPEAVIAGLRMLRDIAGSRRVVAVLGRMNELGDEAEAAHCLVGKEAARTVDYLVAVGQFADIVLEGAKQVGMPAVHMIGFSSTEQLIDKAEQVVVNHDLIYVKGSQNGVRLERFVKHIMAHPQQAHNLLVRQSSYWTRTT